MASEKRPGEAEWRAREAEGNLPPTRREITPDHRNELGSRYTRRGREQKELVFVANVAPVLVEWRRSKRFDPPITLSDGNKLLTLYDARCHLLTLPKANHGCANFAAAVEAVIMAAEGRGPMLHDQVWISQLV